MMTLFSLIALFAASLYMSYKYYIAVEDLQELEATNKNLRMFLSVSEEREANDAAEYARLHNDYTMLYSEMYDAATDCQGPCDRCGDNEPCEQDALDLGFTYDDDGNLIAPLSDIVESRLKWTVTTDGNSAIAYGDDFEDGIDYE